MKKAGWVDGQALGKHGQGIIRPIDGVRLAAGMEKLESLLGSKIVLLKNICGNFLKFITFLFLT